MKLKNVLKYQISLLRFASSHFYLLSYKEPPILVFTIYFRTINQYIVKYLPFFVLWFVVASNWTSAQKVIDLGIAHREKTEQFHGFTEDASGNLYGLSTSEFDEKGDEFWLWKFGKGGTNATKTKLGFTTQDYAYVALLDNAGGAFILAYSKTVYEGYLEMNNRKVIHGLMRIGTNGDVKEKILGEINSSEMRSVAMIDLTLYSLSLEGKLVWAISPDHQKILVSVLQGEGPLHTTMVLDNNLNLLSSNDRAVGFGVRMGDFRQQSAHISNAGDVTVFVKSFFKSTNKFLHIHHLPANGAAHLFTLESEVYTYQHGEALESDGLRIITWADVKSNKSLQFLEVHRIENGDLILQQKVESKNLGTEYLRYSDKNIFGWTAKSPVRVNAFTMPDGRIYITHLTAAPGDVAAFMDFTLIEVKEGTISQQGTVLRRLGRQFPSDGGVFCFSHDGSNYALYESQENRDGFVRSGGPAGYIYLQDLQSIGKNSYKQLTTENNRLFDFQSCYSLQTGGVIFVELVARDQFSFHRLDL